MDLTQLANLGEFIGGVAVLVTLIYLAVQVRGSRRSTDFLVEQGVVAQFNPVNGQIVGSKEVAALYRRGVESFDSLDPDERIQFDLLIQSYMNIHHMIFELGTKGIIPRRLLDATLQEMELNRDMLGLKVAMQRRAFYFSPEFCEVVGIEPGHGHRLGDASQGPS